MKKIKSDRKSLMLQQYQKFRTDEKKKRQFSKITVYLKLSPQMEIIKWSDIKSSSS